MHANIIESVWLTFQHGDNQRLSFAAKSGVDSDFTSNHTCHSKSTPDTRRPPTSPLSLDPVDGRRHRERMHDPRLANMRMQHYSVNAGEAAKKFFNVGGGHSQFAGQFGVGWAA